MDIKNKIVITIIKRKNTNYTIFKEGKIDESNFEWKKEIIVHVNFRDSGKEFLLQGIDNRKVWFSKSNFNELRVIVLNQMLAVK